MVGGLKKSLASLYATTTGRRKGVRRVPGRGRGRGKRRSPSPPAASSSGEEVPSAHEDAVEQQVQEHELEHGEEHELEHGDEQEGEDHGEQQEGRRALVQVCGFEGP